MAMGAPGAARKVDGRRMQQANRAIVLEIVRTDPTLSRAEIARQTGLSPAAVSGIVDHLLTEGLVLEVGPGIAGGLGRRPRRLAFNPSARAALGIALDVREVRAALVDLGGSIAVVERADIPDGAEPAEALAVTARTAGRALAAAGERPVIGVGMAVPGMVGWPGGVLLFSPNAGWREVPVRAEMERLLGRPVLVDNEVRALALAEHRYGAARGVGTAVFLDAGYGMGGAVILAGSLYRGVRGAAAEIGHNTVEPDGPICACGNRGCLEVFASTHGMLVRAADAVAAGVPSILHGAQGALTVPLVLAAAERGDPLAVGLTGRAATYLGLAVANAMDNWDPDLAVLSGPMIRISDPYYAAVLAAANRAVLETGRDRIPIVRATLGNDAKIIGAAALAISDYLAAVGG